MLEAILALVTAIVGMGSSIIKNNSATLSAMIGSNQASVKHERSKEMSLYSNYSNSLIAFVAIVAVIVLLFSVLIYKSM